MLINADKSSISQFNHIEKNKVNFTEETPHASHSESNQTQETRPNFDVFVTRSSDELVTYSPSSLANSGRSTASDSQISKIPTLLAAKMAGLAVDSSNNPIINNQTDSTNYQNAMRTIKGNHANLSYKSSYRYSQTGSNSYGYSNPRQSCATFALATALSIYNNRSITPDKIQTNSSSNGTGTNWNAHGAFPVTASEADTLLAVDAQLQLGNPVLIHAVGKDSSGNDSEHWATVIGKQNGEYTIIDPWNGKECSLDEMQIYKNQGRLTGYVILSNEY